MSEEGCANNVVGLTQYDGLCNFFGSTAPLGQGIGWAVVLGFGLFFSLLTSLFVFLDYHFGSTNFTSEQFNTAGRKIKSGWTASVIVSQGTWAATLLQSSNVAWKYGVSGPFWYAAGTSIQVILFGILAVEIKRKAPSAHTILEIIKYRYGSTAHIVFLVFCFLTNTIVSAMLILGGAAVVEALTGMSIYAAAFLIPFGVMLYTAAGGLKATFIASYMHTAIIYIVLCIFMFQVYTVNDTLGSISIIYGNLQKVSLAKPVENNKDGSYMTMLSEGGAVFGMINIVGGFGTMFVDQSYWQSAIAAKPSATYKGYILGGLCWFSIPFSFATTMGLASRALDLPLSSDEAGSGLVPLAVAQFLLGDGGTILLLLMLFIAVTTTGSSEQVAVGSLVSYDIYKMYINPSASGVQIIAVSRFAICAFGVLSGGVVVALLEIGVNLGWVYLFIGIVIGSAIIPISFTLTWKDANPVGAIAGAIIGMICAVIAWLSYAQLTYGEITVQSTGENLSMLSGSLASICTSGLICTLYSLIYPHKFEWDKLKEIPVIEQDGAPNLAETGEDSPEALLRALRFTVIYGTILAGVIIIVWPLLALPAGVFNEGYFFFWNLLAIVWGVLAGVAMIVLPVWESRHGIFSVFLRTVSCGKNQNLNIQQSVASCKQSGKDVEMAEIQSDETSCYVVEKNAD
eukprot:TRINITY_DN5612_c0_g3_i1.p1 TRINITY_DN5612_c0_g3~~TRINITY_DN5612_c0_g3_i1.p1  ORF type:complete len:683 (+),score=122.91 TRINITY_DN5612_c0_g3_i1:137-2185(+)